MKPKKYSQKHNELYPSPKTANPRVATPEVATPKVSTPTISPSIEWDEIPESKKGGKVKKPLPPVAMKQGGKVKVTKPRH